MEEGEIPNQISKQVSVRKKPKGKPQLKCTDQLDHNISILKIKNWKTKALKRSEWRKILEQTKTQKGLSSQ